MSLQIMHLSEAGKVSARITEALNNGITGAAEAIPSFGMEALDSNPTAHEQQVSAIQHATTTMESILSGATADGMSGQYGQGTEGFGEGQDHMQAGDLQRKELAKYTQAQIRSGAIAMVASAGMESYGKELTKSFNNAINSGLQFNSVSGSRYGSANTKMGYGALAFENAQDLVPHKQMSVEYNIKAAKQDDVGEALFPTTAITANDIGMNIEIPIDIVEPFIKHKADGTPTDWQRKKLLNAVRDPSILRNDSINLIPYKPKDKSNDKWFATDVPDFTRPQSGELVPTGALIPSVEVGFMGLCSTPSLVSAGALESSDQIDTGVKLQYVWIRVTNAAGTKEIIKLRTDHLDNAFFNKTNERDKFEASLEFVHKAYQITKDAAVTVDGTPSALLAPLFTSERHIGISLDIRGDVNHEKGTMKVGSLGNPAITRVYDSISNEYVSLEDSDVKPTIEDLKFEFIGWFPTARLRNSNFRTREQRVDTQTANFRYLVQLGAPITSVAPPTDAWGPVSRVAVDRLVTATFARNSAMAISRVFDYIDTLRSAGITNNGIWQRYDEANIEGVGKSVVDPWFREGKYDLSKLINNIKSKERREDISEHLLNILRNYAYRMNAESGYKVALQQLYGETTPTLVICTDNIIAQYLMEVGDLRTAGINFKVHVATSDNIDMRGKVILTLSRMKSGALDLLTFGMHLWVPEIVATVKINRAGTFVEETMVQPRNLHVVVCPIIALLHISGLDFAYDGKIALEAKVETTDGSLDGIDNTDLDGLKPGQPGNDNDDDTNNG